MPMPNSTTIRITWIELSVLRSKTLLADADQARPRPARPGRSRGSAGPPGSRSGRSGSSARRISTKRGDADDRLGVRRRLLRVEGLGGGAGDAEPQVGALDQGLHRRRAAAWRRRARRGRRGSCRGRSRRRRAGPACSATGAGRRCPRRPGRASAAAGRRSSAPRAESAALSGLPSSRSKTTGSHRRWSAAGTPSSAGRPRGSTRS